MEDIDCYLDSKNPETIHIYEKQRREYYKKEINKITNVTVLEKSQNATLGRWEHEFASPCYQNAVSSIIREYKK